MRPILPLGRARVACCDRLHDAGLSLPMKRFNLAKLSVSACVSDL